MSTQRGRLTRAQRRALDTLLPAYALGDSPFPRSAPLGVEIGFGMGEALEQWALARPDWNLLGVEIYPSGVGALLNRVEQAGLDNVRVAVERAEVVLEEQLAAGSVREFRVLFPDPWPKKRHHKRRLLQPAFISLLAERLEPGGALYVATDWAPYAEWALQNLAAEPSLVNTSEGFSVRDDRRLVTKFEARGKRLGHDIFDLCFIRRRETS